MRYIDLETSRLEVKKDVKKWGSKQQDSMLCNLEHREGTYSGRREFSENTRTADPQ